MAKKHIHLYNTQAQFNAEYNGEAYNEPWLSYTRTEKRTDYNKPIWLDLTGYAYPTSVNDGVIINPEPKTWPDNMGDVVRVKEPSGEVKEYICDGHYHSEENGYVWDDVQYSRYYTEDEYGTHSGHGLTMTKWFQIGEIENPEELPLEWTIFFSD